MGPSGFELDLLLMQLFMAGASAALACRVVDDIRLILASRKRVEERPPRSR